MKESRYVRLARTIFCILKYARIPLFCHRKSNHIFTVWQHLSLLTIRQYEGKSYRMHVPIWKTHGRYRKQMKCGYTKLLYNQRNKDETIISVIKRLFGEYITSRLTRTQNRELSFRCVAYNMHRLTNLVFIVMVST